MIDITLPTNEKEFAVMMEAVDTHLRESDVPIHARPIRGWFEISKALKLGLRMFPRGKAEPSPGIFTGDELTLRIFGWFDERYGDKLAIHPGPGRIVLLIKGDPWEAMLPKIFGTVQFFISPINKSSNQEEDLRLQRIPKYNILDSITGFPPGLARSLDENELHEIANTFISAYNSMALIVEIQDHPMALEIKSDIDAAVSHFMASPAHYGMSKWSSLQATEKSLKAYLKKIKLDPPRGKTGHDLIHLSLLANEHGLPAIPAEIIKKIQCSASVRYGEEQVNKHEAYLAHLASVEICGFVAKNIQDLTSESNRPPSSAVDS